VYEQRYHPAGQLLRDVQDVVLARERLPSGLEADPPHRLRGQLLDQLREISAGRMRETELRGRLASLEQQLRDSEERRERADRVLADVMDSVSWKLTTPLRLAKRGPRPRA
jgi:hypothetical protein